MPEFGSPFAGLTKDKKLTNEELIRAIRFVISAEYEATQMYMQVAESSDNELVSKVLKSVADEERVHAGEFLKLLHEIAPDEAKHYEEGEKEVEDMAKGKVEESIVREEQQDWKTGIADGDESAFWEFVVCTNEEDCDSGETGGISQKELNRLKKEWVSQDPKDKLKWHRLVESVITINRLIDEKKVTADDFNRFIVETSPTSINKRVQRQMKHDKIGPQVSSLGRQVDDKTDHEPADHNDPTTTLRGKSALRRRIKHNKAHPDQFREAIEFLQTNSKKPLEECKLKLCDIIDQASLHRLVTRLLQRPSQFDHEWLAGLDNLMSNHIYGKTHV